MPVSPEGLEYTRHLFKPIEKSETGGCHVDVYLPEKSVVGPYPVALSIHGGGFSTGDSLTTFRGHTKYLLDRGFCVVCTEYRLAPHARFREMREDWLDAYRWIKFKLSQLAEGRVDPSRVFVMGGSAGGTAAIFTTLDAQTAGLPPPQAVYLIYTPTDFDTMWSDRPAVDYEEIDELFATLPGKEQESIQEMINGPQITAYDYLWTESTRATTGRWMWYILACTRQYLITCILEHPGPPYPPETSFLHNVTSAFPPTIWVKALADAALDPEQTSVGYRKLKSLGVDTELIEAKDMLHGDAEGENGMMDHPPREEYFWKEVYNVALDWCIKRTIEGENSVHKEFENGGPKVL